jgi:YidC/Oxa1 family membrane protein insertase
MDRNSGIGLVLIAVLLLVYFYWFSPKPQPQTVQEPATATESITPPSETPLSSIEEDSILTATYGDLSGLLKGEEKITTITTHDLTLSFTNHGGVIHELELNRYKTYYKQPLKLIQPGSTTFQLLGTVNGREMDLYSFYYESSQQKVGDSTILTFTAKLNDGSSLIQRYSVPDKGYEIKYSLIAGGFERQLESENLSFTWNQLIRPTEKDITDTRNYTTINYYSPSDGFDYLAERSTSTEEEIFSSPIQWISIKQKYFISSIIAKNNFNNGQIEMATNVSDTSVVKRATVKLNFGKTDLTNGKASFKFYIGPNDYQVIGKVAEDFAKNVYLGWPPVYWVNKFVIFPVFHFLTLHLANYGIIIIILVILLKLVLAPLSYRSYLSMAKMKVLKPELDEIKEKHADDMAKVQQEQLKLYQQVGVNPVSGCIPVLLQMPIIFAMFYLFPNSIELRQQPLLWAEDLSTYDSLIRLPFTIPFGVGSHISLFTLLMTVSTLIYTWQNNQLTSVQGPMKSMSYIMPIIFFFVLNSFPTGLTFYYFVSNLATFAQQAIIKRFVNEDKIKTILDENRKKIAAGSGKKSKFMTKLEEAMKAGEAARKNAGESKKKKKN